MTSQGAHRLLRLEIDPVIQRAEHLAEHVERELPAHSGIIRAAQGVAQAAHEAKRVARALRRPWGLHRLPALFLAVALLLFGGWVYWNFLHVATLTIALPEEDAIQLRERTARSGRVRFQKRTTEGSREGAQLLLEGKVDLAFVQGGIPIAEDLPRLQNPRSEVVLYFVRNGIDHPVQVRKILTSAEGQGSHSVTQVFADLWKIADHVQFVYDWRKFSADPAYVIPADVDAVFVIKDLAEHQALNAAERLVAAGFRLASPDLGAHALALDYLQPTEIPRGYLSQDPPIPEQPVATYSVATYLVARRDLTPRRLAAAAHLLDKDANTLTQRGFEPTVGEAAEVLQGLDSFLSILVYIGLAFLALLGLEAVSYRRRFHELNTLISLISMHQSEKDVLGLTNDTRRRENLLYLSICSDLLGLISVIGGYYSQENSSLLYSSLLDTIHERSHGMKLNIQSKIMHASISLAPPETHPAPPPGEGAPATKAPGITDDGPNYEDQGDE